MWSRSIIPLALVGVLGYGLVEAYPLLAGPSIVLSAPLDGATAADGTVTVSGIAKRIQDLSLDGMPVLPDENGAFSESFALPAGGAILSLTGRDRFGRATTIERRIIVLPAPAETGPAATSSANS